jgi:hypothetical protein
MSEEESEEDIIHVEGRKPFDKSKLRLAREGYKDRKTEGYISKQSLINVGPGGTINQNVLDNYLSKREYEEVLPKDVDKIPIGSRIAYITKTQKWRSAGWLSGVGESYEDFDGNTFKKARKYILYKSYSNSCFCCQIKDVKMFYAIMPKNPEIIKIITFKIPTKITNFPVIIKDDNNNDVCIYMAKDEFQRKKFKSTSKFKRASEDPEIWEFDNRTQTYEIDNEEEEEEEE